MLSAGMGKDNQFQVIQQSDSPPESRACLLDTSSPLFVGQLLCQQDYREKLLNGFPLNSDGGLSTEQTPLTFGSDPDKGEGSDLSGNNAWRGTSVVFRWLVSMS